LAKFATSEGKFKNFYNKPSILTFYSISIMTKKLLSTRIWILSLLFLLGSYGSFGQYCTPSYSLGCSNGSTIQSFVTSGAYYNIINYGSACGTSYDYTDDMFVTAILGTTVNISGAVAKYGGGIKIWVDWNQDEDFEDTGELVYESSLISTGGTFSGSFTVPTTATLGATRMRVRDVEGSTSFTACGSYTYGEAEDYTFNVIDPDACSASAITDITISGPDSTCGGLPIIVSADIDPEVDGITKVWQTKVGTGAWATITGTDLPYYDADGITDSTSYRLIVSCPASGDSDTSNVITVYRYPASECYCTPYSTGYTYGCSSWRIDSFSTTGGISNISNLNTNCSSGSYGDYSDLLASQYQGSVINYSVKLEYPGGASTGKLKMWIDWNQDGTFSESDVIYNSSSASSAAAITGSFEVPTTAVAGTTRLRIKTQMYNSITSDCAFATYDYNEVEDYSFEVVVPDPCEDATFTDITLSGPDSVCSGTNPFTITSEGTPIASGLTKVWEQRVPSGTGTWTVITGASSSFLNVSGITDATDYRYTVTCVATGESEVSDVWTVGLNPPTECYCIPTFTYGCVYSYNIDDVETSGGISDISNLGTGCPSSSVNGFSDYRDQFVSAYQGTVVNYTIGLSSAYLGAKMWIDWNQDGDFSDAGELMYQSSTMSGIYAPTTITGSFEVPYDAVPGSTGMRIRVFNSYTLYDYLDACYTYSYGETEDYTFNVVQPDPCDEVPFTGLSIEGPEDICAANAFTITSDGTPIASGLTRIWQKKTATSGWTTISGATTLSYTVAAGITEATDFRYIVLCTLTGESDTSNVLSVSMNPPTECYCVAEFYGAYDMDTYTWNDYKIKDFIINGQTDTLFSLNTPFPFDGTSPGDLGGYTDYTVDTPTLHIPDLVQTGTYSGQVKVRYSSPYVIDRIWIDYDDDGVFESTEAIHTSTTSYPAFSSSSPDNFSFTMPADANPGIHRLRVRAIYLYSSPLPIDPCYTYQYGQTQDYLVEVVELKPCAEVTFPESVAALASPPNVCGSGDITLTLADAMPLAAGITYQWKSSASETGTYTNVGAELPGISGPTLTVTGVSTDLYYRCYVLCEGEAILISDAVYVQSVDVDDVVLTTEDGQTCGPGTVTLGGSTTDGSVFWYLNPAGGSPIWMGDEYVTPPLTVTDTFYATGGAFGRAEGIVGTGSSSGYYYYNGPFTPYFGGQVLQYMYTADQLNESGIDRAGNITGIKFNCSELPSHDLNDYIIKIKTVTTAPPLTWQTTGWTEVYNTATLSPSATGWVDFPFSSDFSWNGIDNIVIEVCFYGAVPYTYYWPTTGGHKYTNISGQALYYTSGSVTASNCATASYGYSTTYFPNTMFMMEGCETERVPVIAYVRPVPAPINIGPDETICKDPDNGMTLDAGDQPDTYTFLWDDGSTMQTRRITESGTYYAEVANEYGCAVYDTVTKTLLDIPMVELGNDTTICEGGTLMLSAGTDGTSYYWSTGATTSTIEVITGGEYTVVVANANDCISLDTIDITVSGTMPSVASIIVTNTDLYTFSFEPLLPAHIVSYEWDFGDGSETSSLENPSHTYATAGSYTITLTVKSECGEVVYTTTAHIVGVNNVSIDDRSVTLYPNPAREIAVIESKGDLKMKSVTVTNVLGQVMYTAEADAATKHQLTLSQYASGIYTVRIDTDKGVIVRKFEIVK